MKKILNEKEVQVMNQYEEPKMEVIEFEVEDVITTSGTPGIDLPDDGLIF